MGIGAAIYAGAPCQTCSGGIKFQSNNPVQPTFMSPPERTLDGPVGLHNTLALPLAGPKSDGGPIYRPITGVFLLKRAADGRRVKNSLGGLAALPRLAPLRELVA